MDSTTPILLDTTVSQTTLIPTTMNSTVNPSTPTLCLNMIVKNESKIITRCLQAVLPIIDTYCICDTGSTDNTEEVIHEFFKAHDISGVVFKEPFQNFGYNRTVALEKAKGMATYALLVDADMILKVSPDFKKSDLTKDVYSIVQKNVAIEYSNVRLVKTEAGVKCLGVTHEYYDIPQGKSEGSLKTLWIDDIGDGGAKADKFERDIRLLTGDLARDPKNPRTHFYLANTYKDSGKFEEAIKHYKERVEIGGWYEETWQSAVNIGHCYNGMNQKEHAVWWWLKAYQLHQGRSENFYEITKLFRIQNENKIADIFLQKGKSIPFPENDKLFIQTPVYDYLLDYEESIINYYTGKPVSQHKYLNLIGKNYNTQNVLSNYKFYKYVLSQHATQKKEYSDTREVKVGDHTIHFRSSSPSILNHPEDADKILMNVRYVNYKIKPDGGYHVLHPDEKICTRNLQVTLNRSDLTIAEKSDDVFPEIPSPESMRYDGVEDVRLHLNPDKTVGFLGTVQDPSTKNLTVGKGVYKDTLTSTALSSPNGRGCEKNWQMIPGTEKMVYDWSPLTILTPTDPATNPEKPYNLEITDAKVPGFMKQVRGSSPGFQVGNEIWYVCHVVSYESPRNYYHLIVALDATTYTLKRNTHLFTFEGEAIEYCLGLIVEPSNVLFSYSTWDRTTKIMEIPREKIEALFNQPSL